MIYLLDTNALSDLARKRPSFETRMSEAVGAADVPTCVVAVGEILQGIERLPAGRKRDALHNQVRTILSTIPCEPVPITAAVIYATIKTQRQTAGRPMDANDLWIAATALALGAVLVSHDADFSDIPGLTVEDWIA